MTRGRPREPLEVQIERVAREVALPWLVVMTRAGAIGVGTSAYRAFMYVKARGLGLVVLEWMEQNGLIDWDREGGVVYLTNMKEDVK